jgi:hypothetical protein
MGISKLVLRRRCSGPTFSTRPRRSGAVRLMSRDRPAHERYGRGQMMRSGWSRVTSRGHDLKAPRVGRALPRWIRRLLRDRDEQALTRAYELGRSAVAELSALDLASAHRHALLNSLRSEAPYATRAAASPRRGLAATRSTSKHRSVVGLASATKNKRRSGAAGATAGAVAKER